MNKNLMAILITIVFLTFIGCQNEVEKIVYVDKTTDGEQGGQVTPPQNNTKITSLQVAINTAEPGSIIDFSDPKYSTITTIEPSININKAVTIKNFDDLKGASLNVSADGVVLSNLGKTSVTTNSSLKISGSSLSSLNIGAVDTGRGEPIVKSRPPKVELLSSDVSSDVIIAIENAALTVFDVTADNIRFDANDTQLTIENKDSVIKNILTDKKCRLVLEDGTSDTIPCSDQKISVSGTGQLTQVNMQAAETLILTKLSPESGLITTMKQDESIDFSSLEVIGTYQKSGAITIYEAGLTYEFVDTVTRLEDVFRIKIGNDTVYTSIGLDENDVRIGQYADFDWTTLQPGYHQAIIEKDFANTALDYRYKFRIAVIDKNVEYHLSDLTVDISNMKKKTYLADETLDLTGLVVKGTYHADAVLAAVDDYEKVLLPSEYTVTPAEGYELTTDVEKNIKVTVSANDSDKSAEFEVTVKPSCYVTFNYGYKQEIVRIEQDTKIEKPEPVRCGYEFKGWYSNVERTQLFNFNTNIENDMPLYAKWSKKKPFVGAIVYADATTADKANDAFIFVENPIQNKTPIGIVFNNNNNTQVAKIVHLSQYEDNIKWCTGSANAYTLQEIGTSLDEGSGNWQIICNDVTDENVSGKYPVFEYVKNLTNDVTSDGQKWYLPALRELSGFSSSSASGTINISLKALNDTGVYTRDIILNDKNANVCYWSSSFYSVNRAYYYCPNKNTDLVSNNMAHDNETSSYQGKTDYYVFRARAIRKCYYKDSTTGENLYVYE